MRSELGEGPSGEVGISLARREMGDLGSWQRAAVFRSLFACPLYSSVMCFSVSRCIISGDSRDQAVTSVTPEQLPAGA